MSRHFRTVAALLIAGAVASPAFAAAPFTAFKQSVAVAAAEDDALSTFYRETAYEPIWTGADADDLARREALLTAIGKSAMHGLPAGQFEPDRLRRMMSSARNDRSRGEVEVELSRTFLRFARALKTGILEPARVVPEIKREVAGIDRLEILRAFATAQPHSYMATLTPRSMEYNRLIREKLKLEEVIAGGGWGAEIQSGRLERGAEGSDVVALRDRLTAMGYLRRSATRVFDAEMEKAVQAFQADFGLAQDGVVGGKTRDELNANAVDRLGQVLVAMERERWLPEERGDSHIWVNLTDFRARIIVDGETFFETKSVIGKNIPSRETPEFSDEMDHMVINPSWYVPRSIIVNEYLPGLRRNPYAHGHLQVIDRNGRVVSRGRGFSQYTARSFPFSMKQPPSPSNALGRVKFMFPNKYNIYLHDTPAKSLFSREVRAFSHGCIRLNDPFEFAHALLSMQEDEPEAFFERHLRTGREARVNLETPLPVHLIYRTAVAKPGGGMQFRDDIYGRDGRILAALKAAGVALPGAGI